MSKIETTSKVPHQQDKPQKLRRANTEPSILDRVHKSLPPLHIPPAKPGKGYPQVKKDPQFTHELQSTPLGLQKQPKKAILDYA